TQATSAQITSEQQEDQPAKEAPNLVPVKVTSKMSERETYLKQIKDAENEEEEDLEVLDLLDDEEEGKRSAQNLDPIPPAISQAGKKRTRTAMDPFAGGETSEKNYSTSSLIQLFSQRLW